ncbi:hypothetical protein GIB67_039522 [Kingdonia uniflora]|uniref:Uncharacterized protein n=1 Tax=Kingdonia uniflora TaxID=39325 RepID=A0A7J7LJ47_9MAGN|nr:hypothetical protein GIB67_039522 [Kingdonia uniflora]
MPPKNKNAQKEVTGDPSQDIPKQAKLLNGEKLHTYLAYASINKNLSTFRKGGLPYEDLMEAIFVNRVTTGQYVTGSSKDDFIDMATSGVSANLIFEDENNVLTDLTEGDTDTSPIIILNHLGVHFILDLKSSPPSLNQGDLHRITLHSLYLNQCHLLLSRKVVAEVERKNKKMKALRIN